ncbi:MAG: class I SAM-dependent methyltransferase [Acidimicrobiales bacterium]
MVALARAHLTRKGLLQDPHARGMLPPPWTGIEAALALPGLSRLGQNQSFAYLGARTLFYDELVNGALDDGIRQVVILGAGYDSRGWRLARPGVAFFEVDLAGTQDRKRSSSPEGGPRFIPLDVAEEALGDRLVEAGFESEEASVFTLEGLTMYLPPEAVERLLRRLADLGGTNSRLGANFGIGFERFGTSRGRLAARAVAAGGEQFRFRLDPRDAPGFLAGTGWTIQQLMTGPELGTKYLTGTDWERIGLNPGAFAVAASRS